MGSCESCNIRNKDQSAEAIHKPDVIKEICTGDKIYIEVKKINEATKSVCKINYTINNSIVHGTGFFMNFLDDSNNIYRYLVTNYHVISEKLINQEIEIEMYNEKKVKLELDTNLLNIEFFKDVYDVTAIQINDNNSEIIENVKFLDCDMNYLYGYKEYENKDVFALGYPLGKEISNSQGKIVKINKYEFEHDMPTKVGSSGSPVILLNNSKLIGIHKQGNIIKKINEGTFIGIIIELLQERLKQQRREKDNISIRNENINKDINTNNIKDNEDNKEIYNNGDRYVGGFKNGLKEGKGIDYCSNGEIYDGDFKNGLREGKGIYIWPDGDRYEGDFKNGVREGKGVMYYKNGYSNKYDGEFKNDKREGKGIEYYNNGDRYEGDFKDNIPEGRGTAYHKNGNRYEGEFKNGKPEGTGIYYWTDGNKYVGEFKNGIREGKGTMYYTNGNKYEGDYKNGKSEGKGKFYFNSGDRYEGDFKDGKPEGKGTMYHKNGDRYEGDYKSGRPEGKGMMYHRNVIK